MSPSIKYYLRSFLPLGITYFILSLLLDLAYGRDLQPIDSLIESFFFALILTGIFHFIHYGYVKDKLKRTPTYEDLRPVREETLMLNSSLNEIYGHLEKEPLKGTELSHYKNGIIQLKVPASGSSWGELVEIEALNENESQFLIRSRPKVNLNLFDNGKSIENLDSLKEHFKKLGITSPE